MLLVGLCGGSGSGKSTAARRFQENGIPVLDADAVYRELTSAPSPCLDAIAREFGDEVIAPDGSLDRKALSRAVFSAPDADVRRARLNEITHAFVIEELLGCVRSLFDQGKPVVMLDVPLLFEAGLDRHCDITVCVVAPIGERVRRLILRDGLTEEDAHRRIAAQHTDAFLEQRCDFCIRNDADLASLYSEVDALASTLYNKSII